MRIFISYRRDDSSAWTGRLADALSGQYGVGSVFQDITTVRPGERFTDAIDSALRAADATLAVIGPRWLTAAAIDGTPRLNDPEDHVRRELGTALLHGKPLVPVLVGGAAMPTAAQLPEDLRPLATLQAVVMRDDSWHRDLAQLVAGLGAAPPRRRTKRPTGVAAVVVAVALLGGAATWLLLRDRDGTSASPPGATTVSPGTCATPQAPEWTSLARSGVAGGGPGAAWSFEVAGAGYRAVAPGRWQLVVRAVATNRAEGSQTHYPFYALVLDGDAFRLDCFQVVDGPDQVSPGVSSTALVGFEVDREPTGALALDVDSSGERFRIDLPGS